MMTEKVPQEAKTDGNLELPQSQEPQHPDPAQEHNTQNGTEPAQNHWQDLPADLIQVEQEKGYA